MPIIIQETGRQIFDLLVEPMQSRPLSHSLHLAEEKASHSESQSPQLTGNWRKRQNTEYSDADEDFQLHKLMEDIKRYIRGIDISNL